jgi:ribonuclease BN (tRNA processing enzyme)
LEAMEVFFPGSSRVQRKFPVEFAEMKERTESRFGEIAVTPFPVVHSSGSTSFALRVRCGGKEIGYSGDTEWTDTLIEAARGTDLFICECYLFDKKLNYHLNYRILKDQKENLGSRRLILTHLGEETLARLSSIEGMEWAEDGKKILL